MAKSEDQHEPRDVARYFAIILLGPILLLVCWGAFKIGLEDRFAGRNSAGYPGYIAAPPPDVLLIGSSHTRQSYDVEAIEFATGRSAYILAYGSLNMNYMDMILQQVLQDSAHRPKIVVLEAFSAMLSHPPEVGDYRLFFDAPPSLKLKLMSNYLRFHPGASAWLDLFDLVVNRGTDQLLTFPLNNRMMANLSYKGGYRGHIVQGIDESEFQSLHADIVGSSPDPAQLAALRHIIEICREGKVRLVLAESPMPKPVSSKPEIQSLKRVFRDEASANHLPYLDGDDGFPTTDPALFADAGHLSTAGRNLYTSSLIARFGPILSERDQVASGPHAASFTQAHASPQD
jgi:hypothetical protein